jgi:hypothetical protein
VIVTIGNLDFDRVRYDAEGDVLYLHRADPKEAVDFDGSPGRRPRPAPPPRGHFR